MRKLSIAILIFILLAINPIFQQNIDSKTFFAIKDVDNKIITVLDVNCINCELLDKGCKIEYLFGEKPTRYTFSQPTEKIDLNYSEEHESNSKQIQSAAKSYAASKNSEVFHSINCNYVDRISNSNLVFFTSREEAIASGRRPCKVCSP